MTRTRTGLGALMAMVAIAASELFNRARMAWLLACGALLAGVFVRAPRGTEMHPETLRMLRLAGSFAEPSVDTLDEIDGFSAEDYDAFVQNTNPFEQTNALLGDVLFPFERTEELTAKTLKGGSNAAVAANVTSHLAEAPIVHRQAVSSITYDIPAIKQKRHQDAETLIRLRSGRPAVVQQAVDSIFDDVTGVRRAVLVTIEYLRMQALSSGQVALNYAGGTINGAIDFQVPSDHKETLAGNDLWSDTVNSTPLNDLDGWVNKLVGDRGNAPQAAITSSRVVNALRAHPTVHKAVHGINSDRVVTLAQLNELMRAMELPILVVYDKMAQIEAANGTRTNTRFFPDTKIVLVPTIGRLGSTKVAPTPQEAVSSILPGRLAIDPARVAVHTYLNSTDPVGVMTLATASAFPSFEAADDVFIASVL